MRQQGGVSTGEGAAATTKGPKRAGTDDADSATAGEYCALMQDMGMPHGGEK